MLTSMWLPLMMKLQSLSWNLLSWNLLKSLFLSSLLICFKVPGVIAYSKANMNKCVSSIGPNGIESDSTLSGVALNTSVNVSVIPHAASDTPLSKPTLTIEAQVRPFITNLC